MQHRDILFDGKDTAEHTLVLAHGAGSGMRTPFMNTVARAVSDAGIRVARFEFPYMAAGKKRPDSQTVLLDAWRDVAKELGGGGHLFIGGKSMGGRMASMVADEIHARGLICLGYPFHPPGNPEKVRTAHLHDLQTPTLIVQGTRDPFGTREDVEGYELSPAIHIEWLEDAEHSFKPRARSSNERENLERAVSAIVRFVTRQ